MKKKNTKKENQKLENYHKFGKRYAIFIAFYIWIIERNSFCDWQIKAIREKKTNHNIHHYLSKTQSKKNKQNIHFHIFFSLFLLKISVYSAFLHWI